MQQFLSAADAGKGCHGQFFSSGPAVVPRKRNIRICVDHARPARPACIKRIIAVHQADAAMRPAQRVQDIILIHIFSPMREKDATGSFFLPGLLWQMQKVRCCSPCIFPGVLVS